MRTYERGKIKLYCGECLDVLRDLDYTDVVVANSIDAVVTDPPYGLGFMGLEFDRTVPAGRYWRAIIRLMKPGATALVFGGTRTFHRVAVAIEDSGYEIRDSIAWIHGQGFPKSLDISKSLDKAAGAEREIVGTWKPTGAARPNKGKRGHSAAKSGIERDPDPGVLIPITKAATDAARTWSGWGTALKPAFEPIIVGMKPTAGTYAENAKRYSVAGLAIDRSRIPIDQDADARDVNRAINVGKRKADKGNGHKWGLNAESGEQKDVLTPAGRWPSNVILDESTAEILDEQSGAVGGGFGIRGGSPDGRIYGGGFPRGDRRSVGFRDAGGASRFFYCAKASAADRGPGNNHPTVKPLKLIEYLVGLVSTPTGGTILDPFLGSGTTAVAAIRAGRPMIGIEQKPEYFAIAVERAERAFEEFSLFAPAAAVIS